MLEDAHAVSRDIPAPELLDRRFKRAEEQRQQGIVRVAAEHVVKLIDQLRRFLRAFCAGKRLALLMQLLELHFRDIRNRALQRKRHHHTADFEDAANLLARELTAVVGHDRN